MQANFAIDAPSFAFRCRQMVLSDRPLVIRYGIPFVAVAIATLLASLLPSRVDPSHFTLYYLVVIVSTWYGGFGAGLVSTILSAGALDYFFVSPIDSIELDAHAIVRLCVFLVVALVTNILTLARRRAEADLRQAHAQLEERVQERTAELAATNDTLRQEIDERRKLERELLRVQQQIGRVERLATLGRITATVAHDLGTPLNSVLGYTQLLAKDELPERARRRLAIIETQIHRMGEIIQNYLSYARANPQRAQINLNELIRDTVLLLQPVFQQRQVAVATELGESLPIIYGDGNSIQRVLINLMDNAVDACTSGGKVTIAAFQQTGPNQREQGVILEVADTGEGIAAELLPQVFDLFVTSKAPGKGTGLGLVICQEIVKAHGGRINIASELGKGTRVTVFLPVQPVADAVNSAEDHDERANIDR